jgi:outer membrane receptor protein involved in Fe transport
MRIICGSALTMLLVCWAGTATAVAEVVGSTEAALDEIVVTAQKRSENLQDVPIAISAISGDELEASGASSVTALAEVTPGLQMQTTQGSISPRIRGVGSDLPNVENSVAMYVDGVYIASPSASLLSLNNVAQVETLKGPQGTLFGRNATGGALLIQTREPTENLSGKFDVSYGNYQTTTVNGYVADGLTPAVAADFAVHAAHQGEGYGKNLFTGSDVYQANLDLALRSKWVLKPTEADTVHLIFDFSVHSYDPSACRKHRREGSAVLSGAPAVIAGQLPVKVADLGRWPISNAATGVPRRRIIFRRGLILPLSSFRQSLRRCCVLITSTHLSIPRIT